MSFTLWRYRCAALDVNYISCREIFNLTCRQISRTGHSRHRCRSLVLRISGRIGWLISDFMFIFAVSIRALACSLEVPASFVRSPDFLVPREIWVIVLFQLDQHRDHPITSLTILRYLELPRFLVQFRLENVRQVAEDSNATINLLVLQRRRTGPLGSWTRTVRLSKGHHLITPSPHPLVFGMA